MKYSRKDLTELNKLPIEELVKLARKKTDQIHGKKVLLRGLIEHSNICSLNCLYCGIRSSNKNVDRYHLTHEEILAIVKKGFDTGLRTFVLQGGEVASDKTQSICSLVSKIKQITRNEAAVTLSLGIKSYSEYKEMVDAGADRYLLRFETANPELHRYIRNGLSLFSRLRALEDIRKAGFEVGSGFMVGLPGESDNDLVENILLASELELDMGGIGPFIPHDDTPLSGSKQSPIDLTVKATALLRLALPECHIPATTAAGSLDPLGREKSIEAGANVLMPNITPVAVKKNYLLYPGKICLDEDGGECIGCMSMRVKRVGCTIDYGIGSALRLAKNQIKEA